MKDIPMFATDTGVSTLLLKEVPYKEIAYIKVHDVQPGGLREHLEECAAFCGMCGAEHIYAAGHPELEAWPLHCAVIRMTLPLYAQVEPEACLFPVTETNVSRWREVYNDRMKDVDNAATLTAFDEKEIVTSGGAYFVHDDGVLLGIGWLRGNELLAIASARRGAGERVLKTLLSTVDDDCVSLEVASTNSRAIALYARNGFLPVGERARWHRIR